MKLSARKVISYYRAGFMDAWGRERGKGAKYSHTYTHTWVGAPHLYFLAALIINSHAVLPSWLPYSYKLLSNLLMRQDGEMFMQVVFIC